MKPQRHSLLFATITASSLLCSNAFSQVATGPVFESGEGLAQLDAEHPLYDPRVFLYTLPPGPNGPLPMVRESLFEVSLTVEDDGSVDDVEILDGFYDSRMSRFIRDAFESSRFTPATADGAAVEWPQLVVRVVMRGANPPGISEEMRLEFNELAELITAEDWDTAEKAARNLLEDDALRLFELALIKDQLATIYVETERLPQAILASRMATARSAAVMPTAEQATPEAAGATFPEEFLNPELHLTAQRKHFILALLGNQTGEALQVFEQMQATAASLGQEVEADITSQVESLRGILASDANVGSAVELVNGSWEFTMSPRRIFGVTGLEGEVDYIDVNCGANPPRRLSFTNDSEWRIPDSWGQCTLAFKGREGSKFNLFEYLN